MDHLKILVCGMPRSMTTWAFNVLRELIATPRIHSIWIAPASPQEAQFAACDGVVLAKCHHFSPALAAAADIVLYSYRDIRSAAVSYHRKFASPCTREQLDNWVEAERAWLPLADAVLRYENVEREPLAGIAALRKLLADKAGDLELSQLTDAQVLARVDASFRGTQDTTDIAYDASTMILPGHRTFQPESDALPPEERALYERIGTEFSGWLVDHEYLPPLDHGQEIEYRIAATLLAAFERPTVVDVGVERGSFTQLALDAGSSRVIGFEPLPRHLEFLRERFGSIARVDIHALAVSRASGTAQLHVATDLEGNELDFHHTLSDLGDSATVIRSRRLLEVRTRTLADMVLEGAIPADLDFLKIDTDGHDLAVLEGLGPLQPRIIMAEYWDTLPESSGTNLYGLADLWRWAREHDYARMVVVRRHGRIELVQQDAPWSVPGDWGNVFFLRSDLPHAHLEAALEGFARESYDNVCGYVAALMRETEAKEAEIRRLDAAVQELRALMRHQPAAGTPGGEPAARLRSELEQKEAVIQGLARTAEEKDAVIRTLHSAFAQIESLRNSLEEKELAVRALHQAVETPEIHVALARGLEEKEKVIRELSNAVDAYRAAFSVLGFAMRPLIFGIGGARGLARRSLGFLVPRLGVLNQHAPRKMALPAHYMRPPRVDPAPRIAIVTPSFKQAAFIERTLDSVLSQRYPNLEYHVQDGGSPDATPAILERYAGRLASWESRPDGGQAAAINLGFARTTGEIMGWLNSDDILLPGALAYVADYFNRHPEVDVVYGHRLLIDESDQQIGRWIMPRHDDAVLSWADYIPQETLFWRRRIWDKVGGRVDESFRFAMDWDLLVRFRDAGARFERLPRLLGGFRVHARQKTSAAITDIGFAEMDRIRERVLGRMPSRVEVRKAVLPYLLRHVAADCAWRIRNPRS